MLSAPGRDLFLVAEFPKDEHPLLAGTGFGAIGGMFKLPTAAVPRLGDTYLSIDGGKSFFSTAGDAYVGVVVTPLGG
jgi:hypothetical protein